MWPIITSLLLPPIVNEFSPDRPPYLQLSQNLGLLAGAMFWGFGCDVFGRRYGFTITLGVTAVFGMVSSSAPNFAAIGCFAALWSFGVGGVYSPSLSEKLLTCQVTFLSTQRSFSNFCPELTSIF
jgi:MFS family permease